MVVIPGHANQNNDVNDTPIKLNIIAKILEETEKEKDKQEHVSNV